MIFSILMFLASSYLLAGSSPLESSPQTGTLTSQNTSLTSPPCSSKGQDDGGILPDVIFPKCTATLSPESLRNMVIHGMACACDLSSLGVPRRDDYHYTPGIGAHKFHPRAATFNEARKVCADEGGHLAVINSLAEERVMLDLFGAPETIKDTENTHEAFIGTHDLYTEGDWVTILGDSLHKMGYARWNDGWGGQPDNGSGDQNCGALVNNGGMDDYNCALRLSFYCELTAIRTAY